MVRKAIGFRRAIGVAVAAVLLAGGAAAGAYAQSATTPPGTGAGQAPAAVIKPVPGLHKPRAKETMAKEAEAATPAPAGALDYPPCSKTVKDRCIQLWQAGLSKTYPQCAKAKGQDARAACIESAYKESKK